MLQEDNFGMTEMAMSTSRNAGDDMLLVRFYTTPTQDMKRSQEEGRPIFSDATFIEISAPGDKDSNVMRPIRPGDKERFPEHFRRFEARESQEAIDGTPLEEWTSISRSRVEELKYFNVRTVEQLIGMSDVHAQAIMGIRDLQEKAKKFLEASKLVAEADAIAKKDQMIADLSERLSAMETALLEKSVPAPKQRRKRGPNKPKPALSEIEE